MTGIDEILHNIKKYGDICKQYGAELVLATKTVPKSLLVELSAKCHNLIFGENRVQEFRDKYFESESVDWHFIGRLQTNKVKYLIGKVTLIQSVDRVDLLDEIKRLSKMRGVVTNILIQLNLANEPQKGGVSPSNLDELLSHCDDSVCVKGVMSVLPKEGDLSSLCSAIIKASDKIKLIFNDANIVSIGMSNDYLDALNGGSNMIRLGSAIFGKRGA